ncbi:hypothetical protein CONLIGDRAFT_237382 [Coniochaeta ligniaria NRRL 30616]|uniref:RNA polymerase II degradation factor 1 n=1 Tax=Coniochaeta ligniaria NRRL 30616 TaxID=1408157 RepID=A0A1J7JQU1_9PEZI|nr:hypothetical protein CONLIGDRAFT_237382 [Coniochaeta ligniaria NRRL 30616]
MSEVQSRPAASRGRGPARGGRGGGFTSRGGSRVANKAPNGDSHHDAEATLEDEGEIGQLKQKFGTKIGLIKEMFPTWSDIDILYALQEADGDENLAVTRIADGTATQWGEVSKQKKVPKTKAKSDLFTTTNVDSAPRTGRGGRTGLDGGRGRGRATERGGRGGGRGKVVHAPTNGTRSNETQPLSIPTEESSAWETPRPADDTPTGWGDSTETPAPAAEPTPSATPATSTPTATPKSNVSAPAAPKTWASMLRQVVVPKAAPKPKEAPAPKPAEPIIEPLPPAEPTATEPEAQIETPATQEPSVESIEEPSTVDHPSVVVPEIALPPSNDKLTETNLDQLEDESNPPQTETAASEAADSWNPRGADVSATATPLSGPQHKQEAYKAAPSGYAASALKATERAPLRTPSYQRRVLDQEEAVRMPGNRDQVDRAAVQFGAFSLNEDEDDIDGDREEPETRAQPPVDSPVTQPRASLPPVHPPASLQDAYAAQKPASSLAPSGPAASAIAPPSQPSAASQAPLVGQNIQQYGRFGHSAPSDYSSYYTAGAQDRSQYNNYYNQFGPQQGTQGPPEGPSSQQQQSQRSYMGGNNYNAPSSDNLSQYPQSSAHSQRYGSGSALDNSGNTTPNPSAAQGPPSAQSGQTQPHSQQPHDYQQYSQHPYFNSPYYAAYMNQYQGYNQGGYGGVYGKGSPYGQPGYGMNAQGPYAAHGTSPAGGFAQSALHRADSGGAPGLGEYGRAPSTQAGSQPALGGSGYGGVHDSYSRAAPYGSQAGQSYNAAGSQPGNPPVDDLKQFGDAKAGAGPSPSMGLAARPGSAANNAPSQSGLPPAQSGQQGGFGAASGYGGYPLNAQGQGLHGAQAGGSGYGMSAGGNQGHGNNPYGGGYGGQGGFGGNYYGNQQQQRGWGGNYH